MEKFMNKLFLLIFFIVFSLNSWGMKRGNTGELEDTPAQIKPCSIPKKQIEFLQYFCTLVEQGMGERVEKILENNPDLMRKSKEFGFNILKIAIEKRQKEIVPLIIFYCFDKREKLALNFCKEKCPNYLEALKEYLKFRTKVTAFTLELYDNKFIDFSGQGMGNWDASALAKSLQDNSTIVALNLFNNKIYDEGIKLIFKALQQNKSLKLLNCSCKQVESEVLAWNCIKEKGGLALAELLAVNNTIEKIKIDYNEFGVEGARAIINAFKHNTTLKQLDVRNSDFNGVKVNNKLEEISGVKICNFECQNLVANLIATLNSGDAVEVTTESNLFMGENLCDAMDENPKVRALDDIIAEKLRRNQCIWRLRDSQLPLKISLLLQQLPNEIKLLILASCFDLYWILLQEESKGVDGSNDTLYDYYSWEYELKYPAPNIWPEFSPLEVEDIQAYLATLIR